MSYIFSIEFVFPFGNNIILKQKNAAKNIAMAKTLSSAIVSRTTLVTIDLDKKTLGRLDSNQQRPG